MSKEISRDLMCVSMREGVELWFEKEKLEALLDLMEKRRFINIEGRIINTADISGIYKAEDLEDRTRRKNGMWKCQKVDWWHNRGEICGH